MYLDMTYSCLADSKLLPGKRVDAGCNFPQMPTYVVWELMGGRVPVG